MIYAQIQSCTDLSGAQVQRIAAMRTQPLLTDGVTPDPAWTAFSVPDVSWLSIVNGAIVAATAEPVANVTAAQNAAYARINAGAQSDLAAIVAAYPDLELATWDQQFAEATAYTASNAAATPLLSAISAAMGTGATAQTVAQLAANVLAKSAAYKAASGAVIGQRLALCAEIAATATVEEANAVLWPTATLSTS